MGFEKVCAVVVTFHPDADVLQNLAALHPQVQQLIVVDNGSSPGELALIRAGSTSFGFELIENAANLGIATALNQGVRWAQAHSFDWILLFDQDSRVTERFTETMLDCFTSSPWGDRLGTLVPRYVDKRLGRAIPSDRLSSGTIDAAMTSGSLFRTSTFASHGLFLDQFFIDCVDSEYSLRLRKAGYVIEECAEATLLHSPGSPDQHRLFGKVLFQTTNYSPMRRYYQERNKIWITKHYFRQFPGYCLRLVLYSAKDFVKILLVERRKGRKIAFFLRGVYAGLREL